MAESENAPVQPLARPLTGDEARRVADVAAPMRVIAITFFILAGLGLAVSLLNVVQMGWRSLFPLVLWLGVAPIAIATLRASRQVRAAATTGTTPALVDAVDRLRRLFWTFAIVVFVTLGLAVVFVLATLFADLFFRRRF